MGHRPAQPVPGDPDIARGRAARRLRRGTRFGFREIHTADGRIWLNGRPIYLLAALDQDFYADTISTPPSRAFLDEQMRLAREMGLNLLRVHIKVPDPAYLEAADEAGHPPLVRAAQLDPVLVAVRGARPPDAPAHGRDDGQPPVHRHLDDHQRGLGHPGPVGGAGPAVAARDLRLAQGAGSRPARRRQLGVRDAADAELPRPDGHRRLPPLLSRPRQRGPVADLDRGFRESPGMAVEPARRRAGARRRTARPVASSVAGGCRASTRCSPTGRREPWWFSTGSRYYLPAGVRRRFAAYGLDRIWPTLDELAEATQRHQHEGLQYEIGQMRRHGSIQGYVITELTDLYWEANGLLDIQRRPEGVSPPARGAERAGRGGGGHPEPRPVLARATRGARHGLGIRRRSAAGGPRDLAPRDRGDRHGRGRARRRSVARRGCTRGRHDRRRRR